MGSSRAPRLQLVVRALALLALAALERIRGGFLFLSAHGFVRGVLADGFVFCSSLRGRELFGGEVQQRHGVDQTVRHLRAQIRVLRVSQVKRELPGLRLVLLPDVGPLVRHGALDRRRRRRAIGATGVHAGAPDAERQRLSQELACSVP